MPRRATPMEQATRTTARSSEKRKSARQVSTIAITSRSPAASPCGTACG